MVCFSAMGTTPDEDVRRLRALLKEREVGRHTATAECNLAYMYANAIGVVQDYPEATLLYKSAADTGHARAQTNLGFMYEHGDGALQDYSEAVRLYTLAAASGYTNAQFNLAVLSVVRTFVRRTFGFGVGAGLGLGLSAPLFGEPPIWVRCIHKVQGWCDRSMCVATAARVLTCLLECLLTSTVVLNLSCPFLSSTVVLNLSYPFLSSTVVLNLSCLFLRHDVAHATEQIRRHPYG
jgi:hypothetical protein